MSPWRYFSMVRPYVRGVPIAFAATTIYGWYIVWVSAREAVTALALVLVVQVFAAATGFRSHATCGHYDEVLMAGQSR